MIIFFYLWTFRYQNQVQRKCKVLRNQTVKYFPHFLTDLHHALYCLNYIIIFCTLTITCLILKTEGFRNESTGFAIPRIDSSVCCKLQKLKSFMIVFTICAYLTNSFIFHRMLDNIDLSSQVDELLREVLTLKYFYGANQIISLNYVFRITRVKQWTW